MKTVNKVAVLVGILSGLVAAAVGLVELRDRLGFGRPPDPGPGPASQGDRPPMQPAARARTFQNTLDVLTVIKTDLAKAADADRPARRYLTLTHLHNNRAVTDADLEAARQALRELAGYLSPAGRTAVFRPVDPEQTVFAVDLNELDWDPDDTWRAVLKAYPYGLSHADSPSAELRGRAEEVQKLSGTKLAHVRGDWLAQAVVRAPLGGDGGSLPARGRPVPAAVQALVQRYAGQTLDLAAAAADLALADPQRLDALIRDEPRMRQKLGLGPLADGGTVPRTAWEGRQAGTSPFQEVSRELQLGTPLLNP